jgi:hypothetical protein
MSKLFATATATACTLVVMSACAEPLQESGGYIGAAYGATQYTDDGALEDDFDLFDLDDGGQAWQLYGGYRFFKYFAVEGRYTDFGDYTYKDNFGFGAEIEAKYSTLTAHAIGIYPFGQSGFDIFGQLGLGAVFYEAEFSAPGEQDESFDDSAATFSMGAGVRYTPPRLQQLTVQLAYDVYGFEAEDDFETYDQSVSMAKLGVQYNF